ncbi:hypothetical protein P7C73_g3966, partial [Tremellales sp. Uapishka_1]
MLSSLAAVHAALSQRAGREQRKRGEVVEVPKNAVERPRHNEANYGRGSRPSPSNSISNSPYAPYPQNDQWGVPGRPRTAGGGGWDYPYQAGVEGPPGGPPPGHEDAGPSRRPPSGEYPYQPQYYDPPPGSSGGPQPASAPGTASSGGSMSQLRYPYRPESSNGRELPVPAHYAESEPPSTAHGPPQSPMYPPGVHSTGPQWSSPPPHAPYAHGDPNVYPPSVATESHYPPEHNYGPPPPGSSSSGYYYPPAPPSQPSAAEYYGQHSHQPQGYSSVPPPQNPNTYPPPPYGQPQPPDSSFPYNSSQPQPHASPYPYGYDASRKRRAEDELEDDARKHSRPGTSQPAHLAEAQSWLPPVAERRSSLAISALLGSPQQNVRSRPATADQHGFAAPYYEEQAASATGTNSLPATPALNGTPRRGMNVKSEENSMEQKAKALLGGQAR